MSTMLNQANRLLRSRDPDAIIYRGEDKDIVFGVTAQSGAAANLTGASARFRLGRNFGVAPAIDKAAAVTAPLSGIVTAALTEAETASLSVAQYVYELEIAADGNTYIVAQGVIDVLASLLEAP